jgi:hypothetical protein
MSGEMGMPLAEIGSNLRVGTSAIAMAIRKKEQGVSLKVLIPEK